FARGGHGVLRLLPAIDWQLLARWPRAYVGYSDLTPFLLQVVARLGLAVFHGPMVAADFARGLTADEQEHFLGAVGGRWPRLLPIAGCRAAGSCEGTLLGGCLSMLTATLGTPFAPELDGVLLFVEEIDEPLYRLDRMLTHLRLSGRLAGVRGLIFGHRAALCDGVLKAASWQRLIDRELDFDGPVAWGLPSGHLAPNLTLPLGLPARLEPRRRRLRIGPAGASTPRKAG
ncbi:MAG: LD-carboxypeptidase, partial [Acidobacteria bacterium]